MCLSLCMSVIDNVRREPWMHSEYRIIHKCPWSVFTFQDGKCTGSLGLSLSPILPSNGLKWGMVELRLFFLLQGISCVDYTRQGYGASQIHHPQIPFHRKNQGRTYKEIYWVEHNQQQKQNSTHHIHKTETNALINRGEKGCRIKIPSIRSMSVCSPGVLCYF